MTPRYLIPPGALRNPWYGRYWGYYNRPYGGCGCLYSLFVLLLLWWVFSLFIPGLALWSP